MNEDSSKKSCQFGGCENPADVTSATFGGRHYVSLCSRHHRRAWLAEHLVPTVLFLALVLGTLHLLVTVMIL